MSILEKITSILDGIEEINGKLDRLLASKINIDPIALEEATAPQKTTRIHSPGFEDYKPPVEATTNFALPMTGKYQWYKFVDQEGKVRKCNNNGCDLFLKYNNDKKSYEHWKYDANTGIGGYVQDKCNYYFSEGI